MRGYASEDIWNLNTSLADIIYKRIKAFKESKRIGIPANFIHSNSTSGSINKEDSDRWEQTLDWIVEGWEYMANVSDRQAAIFDKYQMKEAGGVKANWKEYKEECDNVHYHYKRKAQLLFDNWEDLWD